MRHQALAVTPSAREWARTAERPRVLHVFEQVCNLVSQPGEVISLMGPGVDLGPFSAVAPPAFIDAGAQHGFAGWVTPESRVAALGYGIKIGDSILDFDQAERWSPTPDWRSIQTRPLWAHRPLLVGLLRSDSPPGGLAPLVRLTGESRNFEAGAHEAWLDRAWQGAVQIRQGAKDLDADRLRSGARLLAGLGEGLTPSGDDFLIGGIYALWVNFHPSLAGSLAAEISSVAAPRTTALSSTSLKAATRGEAGQLWHGLLTNLAFGSAAGVEVAVRRLLAVGHTSGADSLAGFLFVSEIGGEKR